jgi:stage III sporulation protein SpoIIIAA
MGACGRHSDAAKVRLAYRQSNAKTTPLRDITLKYVLLRFDRIRQSRHSVINSPSECATCERHTTRQNNRT